jgi:uncharacterized protein (DUF885 family)
MRFLLCCLAFSYVPLLAADPAKLSPTAAFQKLVAADWERGLIEFPTRATWLGDKRFADRWPDLSLTAIERRAKQREELLAELKAIDPTTLDKSEQLNYRLFRRQLEIDIAEHPFGLFLLPINQRDGIQDEHSIADVIDFRTQRDYDNWLARLKAFPAYGRQVIALLREGKRRGIIHPQIVLRRLPAQIKQQIVEDPEKSPFYKQFNKELAGVPFDIAFELGIEAKKAIKDGVVPFYRELLDFIEKEYLPAGYEQVGAWQFPRGEEFYALRARGFTTTSLTPDEIHELGLKEVARIRAEMEKVVKQLEYKGTFAEFLQELRTDKKHYYTSSDELLAGYQIISKRIDPQLPKLFKRLPRIPYGVEAIPANIAPDTTTGYYREPSLDGRRAGSFFVNLYRPEMRPKYEMEALTLHEAVPGHHLQIALGQRADKPADVSPASELYRLHRRLGALRRKPRPRAWLLQRSVQQIRPTHLRNVARRPARRRHGHAPQALDPRPLDRVLPRQHGQDRGRHRQRDRPVHRLAGASPGVQDRRAQDPRTTRACGKETRRQVRPPRVPRRGTPRRPGAVGCAGRVGRYLDRAVGPAVPGDVLCNNIVDY